MANDERIDSIISEGAFGELPKLQKQLDQTQAKFVECVLAAEKLNTVIAKSGTFKELEASTKSLNAEMLKLQKLESQSAILQERKKQEIIKTADLEEKQAARREKEEKKEIDRDNARIVREAKKGKTIISNSQLELDAYNNNVNGNKKVTSTLNATDIAQAEATNSATALAKAQDDVADSSKEVSVSTLRIAPSAIAAQRSIRSLTIQLEAYRVMADNATDPAIRQDYNQRIEQTSEQIERLRNVGRRGFDEFGNAVTRSGNALTKVWQGVKMVATLLPGIGIAGLLAFAAEPIIEYIKNLDIFKKSLNDVAKLTALDSSDYKQAVSDVSRLKVAVSEFNSGIITGTELVGIYNEGIGQTATKLTTVTEVEDFYNKKAPAYLEAMFLRAKANSILELSTDKVLEAQKRAVDPSLLDLTRGFVSQFTSLLKGDFSSGDFLSKAVNATAKSQREGVKDLQESSKTLFNLYDEAQKEADEFAKKNGLSFNKPDSDGKINTDAFDLQKQRLEQAKQLFKETADDEKKSLDDRIDAFRDYNETVRAILTLEANNELSKKDTTAKRRLAIQEKLTFDLLQADKDYVSGSEKIFEDQLSKEDKARIRSNQAKLAAINDEEALRLDTLNTAFANRTISEEQYGKLRLDIQRDYLGRYIQEEIKQVEDLLKISTLSADKRAEAEKTLSELKLKYSRTTTQQQIEDNKNVTSKEAENAKIRERLEKELADKRKQFSKEVFDLGNAIVNGSLENEKNKVQEQIDLNEKRKQMDIENVANGIGTEQEKADQIAIIEAKSLARKEQLELKQREIDQKKARFQKAIAIAEVAVNTFKDVAKISTGAAALSVIPIIGPALAAAALAQIPWAIGIGAAQAAAILATPIPQYFTGTESSKGGYALVDELGPEGYIEPGGKSYIGSNKPNIKNLKAGTKIIPHHELVQMMAKPEINAFVGGKEFDLTPLIAAQEANNTKLIKAFANQKSHSTIITKHGWRNTQAKMKDLDDYVRRNFN